MIRQVTWNGSWIPSKELGMDPLYPYFDLENKLESKADETNKVGAVIWWCKIVAEFPSTPPWNSDAAI